MAYAAVISLKHTIQRLKKTQKIPQITKSAYDKELNSLVSMLKKLDDRSSRSVDRSVINELDSKIRDAVWKLEDVLESSLIPDEIQIEINSFFKPVKKLKDEYIGELQKPFTGEEDDVAVLPPIHDESTTVGLSDLSDKIRTELLGWHSEIQTVSLVGMAGIGKTHLASLIYHHPRIVQHFHSRLWVIVGPKDQTNNILVDIVAQIENKPRDLFKGKSELTLRDLLQSSLYGRRYLIVLDDIWSTHVLDYFTQLLPEYNNRSRFLLTTRLQEVAKHYRKTKVHQMPFLDNEDSWKLLWQNVFGGNSFPSPLEKEGRKIAENCEGLPVLILAVANILGGLDMTEIFWKKVADRKTTTFTEAYEQIYEVLFPSYDYLPQHLKPCFLYMGVFPQSREIPLSKLIDFWIVEDFLEPSLWGLQVRLTVMEYVEGIVSNSLAIVCKRSFEIERKIKSWKLHSVYWYLCIKEARKNKFFHVLSKLQDVSIERPRRLSVQNNSLFGLKEAYHSMAADTSSTTRSLLFTGEDHQYPVHICFNMMLLKVLEALAIRFYEFPEEVLKLLQLKYLSLTHYGELPSSINKLQKLQWLTLRRHHNIKLLQRDSSCLPKEIWEMQELRHVRIMGSNLPDPSKDVRLPYLYTLYVNADSCTEVVLKSISDLNKLGITIELQPDAAAETDRCLEHIGEVNLLYSLKCVVLNPRVRSQSAVGHLSNLPRWLRKLSLNGLGYPWKYMSVIGSLPFLQVLKLRCSAFQGPEWETDAKQFESLQFLLLEDIDLVHWTTQDIDSSKILKCFPSLYHLTVRHCFKLKKLPWEIGGSPFLGSIEVDDCSPSVVASAQQIKKKRRLLQLVINSSWK